MVVRCWQRGYGFSPHHKKLARDILSQTLAEVGESPERARVALQVGAPITIREGNWLRNLDPAQNRR